MDVATYGLTETANLRLTDVSSDIGGTTYTALLDGRKVGEVRIGVPGSHRALNSAAALLTALRIGLPAAAAISALEQYSGVRRRFELKGTARGVRVYDEYAYHPSSMSAQLNTMRQVAGDGRLVVAFQPYRLYRTNAFLTELADALCLADEVVMMEVYCPGEERGPGEGGAALARAISSPSCRSSKSRLRKMALRCVISKEAATPFPATSPVAKNRDLPSSARINSQ